MKKKYVILKVLLLACLVPLFAQDPIPNIEYQALIDFYNTTNGDNWQTKWDISSNNLHIEPWHGVVVTNGHIVEINLPRNRLNGAIPASFSNLTSLKKLDLGSSNYGYYTNNLSTSDLNTIASLSNLEYLNLNNCSLSGTIPTSWAQLTKLKTLILSNNNFNGPIFEDIGNLTALENVNLAYNAFTAIPISIENLSSLTELYLENNKLTALPKQLENLSALTLVYVQNNTIDDVVPLLNPNVNLNLRSQNITMAEFTYTGNDVVLTNLPNVTRYKRSTNDFSATNSFNLRIDGTNAATNLVMDATGNLTIPKENLASLTPDKQVTLYQSSGNASGTTITFLTTTVNLPQVPETEYQALVDFYNATDGENSWINKWDVTTNNLNQGAWHGLVIENGHIVEINLPRNRLNGAIPASFSNLTSLKKLDLGSSNYGYYTNNLSTSDLNTIASLSNLEYLNLNNCSLSGTIPNSWAQLTKLKTLILSNNNFNGPIFEDIGNLTALENVNLAYNAFTAIPISMGNLVNLTSINLINNNLNNSGTNFSDLTLTNFNLNDQKVYFESLEIGANEIKIELSLPFTMGLIDGKVIADSGNEFKLYVNGAYKKTAFSNNGQLVFSNINVLNLQATDKLRINQVNGAAVNSNIYYDAISFGKPLVNEEFEILKKIYNATNGNTWTNSWDISENNLNIESWFGVSLKNGHVVSINLSNNNLSGYIPEEITGLSQLKTLVLNNNSIEGSLPLNLNNLTALETLNLNNNQLSGSIPNETSELRNLKQFNIGRNSFSGTIPSVLSDFLALEYLDISNNEFNHVEKKLYYDFTKTYIDLRNQVINYNTLLNLEDGLLNIELSNIAFYDLENNNFEAKNNFVLLVNNITHATTTTNNQGKIIFNDIKIGEIPTNAKISIRQTTGSFTNTVYNFLGIEDKSNVPVVENEYLALVSLYNALNGQQWLNKWDVSTNNLHTNKWFGVSTYNGHIVAIDLSSNLVSGILPDVFNDLPYLNTLNLSYNKLTGIASSLPTSINFIYDRQNVNKGEVDLNKTTLIFDSKINRYEHQRSNYFNQTYNITIGSFTKTVNIPEAGIKLVDLIKVWKVPNNQKIELRQISGEAKNSILNYYLKFETGNTNLDNQINILDLQTSINHIIGNANTFYNFTAADINNDNTINILDLIKQVDIIQNQESTSKTSKTNSLKKQANSTVSKLKIENGKLILDTNGNSVTSFEIIITNAQKESVQELISNQDFSVSIKNKKNQVSILAYSLSASLNGKIELAKINTKTPVIDSAILANSEAQEIALEVVSSTLTTYDIPEKTVFKSYNYPNPFQDKTIITFYASNQDEKSTLLIFDIKGKKLNEIKLKPIYRGNNSIEFKRNNLLPGLYTYTILGKNYTVIATGKMVIK